MLADRVRIGSPSSASKIMVTFISEFMNYYTGETIPYVDNDILLYDMNNNLIATLNGTQNIELDINEKYKYDFIYRGYKKWIEEIKTNDITIVNDSNMTNIPPASPIINEFMTIDRMYKVISSPVEAGYFDFDFKIKEGIVVIKTTVLSY